jgi:hypothetical protein
VSNRHYSPDIPEELDIDEPETLDGRGPRASRNGHRSLRDYSFDDDHGNSGAARSRREFTRRDDGRDQRRRLARTKEEQPFAARPPMNRPASFPRERDASRPSTTTSPRPFLPPRSQQGGPTESRRPGAYPVDGRSRTGGFTQPTRPDSAARPSFAPRPQGFGDARPPMQSRNSTPPRAPHPAPPLPREPIRSQGGMPTRAPDAPYRDGPAYRRPESPRPGQSPRHDDRPRTRRDVPPQDDRRA